MSQETNPTAVDAIPAIAIITREDPLEVARESFVLNYGANRAARKEVRSIDSIDELFIRTGSQEPDATDEEPPVNETIESIFSEPLNNPDAPILSYSETHMITPKKEVSQREPGRIRRVLASAKAIGRSLLAHDAEELSLTPKTNETIPKPNERKSSKQRVAIVALSLLGIGSSSLFIGGSRGNTEGTESPATMRPPAATATTLVEAPVETTTTVTTHVLAAEITAPQDVTSSTTEAPDEVPAAIDTPKIITITEENNSLWKALKSQNPTATDTEIQNAINDIANRYNLDNVNIVHSGNQFTFNS